jgi:hypothetical protein
MKKRPAGICPAGRFVTSTFDGAHCRDCYQKMVTQVTRAQSICDGHLCPQMTKTWSFIFSKVVLNMDYGIESMFL